MNRPAFSLPVLLALADGALAQTQEKNGIQDMRCEQLGLALEQAQAMRFQSARLSIKESDQGSL